jgi:hypothetical protein
VGVAEAAVSVHDASGGDCRISGAARATVIEFEVAAR